MRLSKKVISTTSKILPVKIISIFNIDPDSKLFAPNIQLNLLKEIEEKEGNIVALVHPLYGYNISEYAETKEYTDYIINLMDFIKQNTTPIFLFLLEDQKEKVLNFINSVNPRATIITIPNKNSDPEPIIGKLNSVNFGGQWYKFITILEKLCVKRATVIGELGLDENEDHKHKNRCVHVTKEKLNGLNSIVNDDLVFPNKDYKQTGLQQRRPVYQLNKK